MCNIVSDDLRYVILSEQAVRNAWVVLKQYHGYSDVEALLKDAYAEKIELAGGTLIIQNELPRG